MIPLIPLITAITPFLPLITKAIGEKKGNTTKQAIVSVVAKTTGVTETAQAGYVGALWLVVSDVLSCDDSGLDSIACVSSEHWGALCVSLCVVLANTVRKGRNS